MTDFQKMYQDKLTTPERIAQQVQSGWLIGMDTATSQTPAIMAAMAQHIRNTDITGVKVQTLLDGYPFDVTVTATGDNTMNVTVEQGNSWDFDLPRGSTHNTMNIDYAVRLALAWARTGLESVNQRFRMPALTDEI